MAPNETFKKNFVNFEKSSLNLLKTDGYSMSGNFLAISIGDQKFSRTQAINIKMILTLGPLTNQHRMD